MRSLPLAPAPAASRLSHLRHLPRRSLVAGGGQVREICGSEGTDGRGAWVLQLVEFRGPVGTMSLGPHAVHMIAGIGGPQVEIGSAPPVGLRKERVLHRTGAHLEFRRPTLRAELSRILVLSRVRAAATPILAFADLDGRGSLPEDVQAVVVRSGSVSADGLTAHAMDALILPRSGAERLTVDSVDARVLLVVG
ncbi:hypothetical protein [Microbacterium capsulatum]|uniref:HutD family protein n=1 Tax=Microbacterium capsulatum TaxID=3041921 RepID=A0ABU0XPD0_9MICO|nr:hypothetical protein [Microbacterium sp. ASV81]MDQ4215615.1 hypothetical protein [Microbacterium sp. ASV81]